LWDHWNTRQVMRAGLLTTTLSELNRLYGDYCEATEGREPDVRKAMRAWIAYEGYARRYNRERGLDSVLSVAESNEKAVE
jgi:hypothetical protein